MPSYSYLYFLVLTVMIVEAANTLSAGKQFESFTTVVAEDDTVLLLEIDKQAAELISISEVIQEGDYKHRIRLALVPTEKLSYETKSEKDARKTSKVAAHLPLINEIYVYLNKGSELVYSICLGNGKTNETTLYVFDSESTYIDYMTYNELHSQAFSKSIPIGSNEEICSDVTFEVANNSYYFVVLLAPNSDIHFSYSVNATERIIEINQYTKLYPSCLLDVDDICTLPTNSSILHDSQDLTLIAYVLPNNNFQSKINHLNITVN